MAIIALLIILPLGSVGFTISGYSAATGEVYAQDPVSTNLAAKNNITNLSNTPGDSLYPEIASYRNNVYMVWQDNSFTGNDRNYDIYLKRSNDGGASFDSNITNLSNDAGLSDDVQMVMSGSDIYLTWTDGTLGNRNIFFTRSVDAGNTFSKPVKLSDNTGDSYNPEIAATLGSGNNSYVYAVWNDYSPAGNGGIMLSTSKDRGATFSEPVSLSNNTKNSYPKIAADGNNVVYLVWNNQTLNDTIGGVYLTKSTDNGTRFGQAIKLNNDNKMFGEPQISIASSDDDNNNTSNVYVVWDSYDPNTQRNSGIFFTKSTDDGTNFSDIVTLTSPSSKNSGRFGDVGITVDGRNVFVSWEDNDLGNYEIFLRRSSDFGDTFDSIENLSNNTGESLCPQMDISENGILYTVWEDGAKGKKEIMLFKTIT